MDPGVKLRDLGILTLENCQPSRENKGDALPS